MSVLEKIIERKRERLRASKLPMAELKAKIRDMDAPRDFGGAVRRNAKGGIRLIAELKKASPSRGLIRADFDPAGIARIYDEKADAVSVITEEDFFMGDPAYIALVKAHCRKPVLRKDFIFDEYQIWESRLYGADAILLIETALEGSQAGEYLALAAELGMAALFEVHDMKELENALGAGAGIIGINNRDLKTLKIDLGTTFELKKQIPRGKTVVGESGIRLRDDVLRIEDAGVDAVLVGTVFMEAPDIGKKMDELLGGGDGFRGGNG